MQSLDESFQELRAKVKQGRELNFVSFEPVFYLVYEPSQILEVKRKLRAWKATLKKDGFQVIDISLAKEIHKIIDKHPWKKFWLQQEKITGFNSEQYIKTIKNALITDDALVKTLEKELDKLSSQSNGLFLVTDLESLHPFLRIGQIEAELQGKFEVPTVFLYPGVRTGKTGLKFLEFYPDDGNYRSVHVGG